MLDTLSPQTFLWCIHADDVVGKSCSQEWRVRMEGQTTYGSYPLPGNLLVISNNLLRHAIVGHDFDKLRGRAGSEHGNGGMGGKGRHLHSVIDRSD
jgi:hypothetical protein